MRLSNIIKKNIQTFSIVEKPEEKIELASEMKMFDFFNVFFSLDEKAWSKVPDKIKMKHSFMLLQYLSIKIPDIATFTQNMISPAIIDTLHLMLSRDNGGRSPGWMYTKIPKLDGTMKLDLKKYDKSLVRSFKEKYLLDGKDFESMITYHPSIIEDILKQEQEARDLKKTK